MKFQGDKTKAVFDMVGDAITKQNVKYFFSLTRHTKILNKSKIIYKKKLFLLVKIMLNQTTKFPLFGILCYHT